MRLLGALTTCLAGLAFLAAGTAAASSTYTIYSVAEQEQYVNNSDSRILGVGNNPFGNFKDVTPITSKGNGPFPGDEALFTFSLYSDAALKKKIGTARFTCQYNFEKNAFCDAAFDVDGKGTLIASGGFNFNATRFQMVVTGGSGPFAEKIGVLSEGPSTNHAQRLAFAFK